MTFDGSCNGQILQNIIGFCLVGEVPDGDLYFFFLRARLGTVRVVGWIRVHLLNLIQLNGFS